MILSRFAALALVTPLAMGCPQLLEDDFQNLDTDPGADASAPHGGAGGIGEIGGWGGSGGGTQPIGGAGGTSSGQGGSAQSGATCPEGAAMAPNGNCQLIVTASMSWQSARSNCQALGVGWDLLSVHDAEETRFLASILTTEVWIGADDTDGTEVWRWVRDGSEFWQGGASGTGMNGAYLNWNSGEPNGGGGTDCMRILPSAVWADLDCGDGRASVCEGPPPLGL